MSTTDNDFKGSQESDRTKMTIEIAAALNMIHGDDYVSLAERKETYNPLRLMSYPRLCFHVAYGYFKFLFSSWMWTIWNIATLPMSPLDFVSHIFWLVYSNLLLTIFAIFCLTLRNPIAYTAFNKWSDKNTGGFNIINAARPEIFTSLSPEQFAAARSAMSKDIKESKDNNYQRTFDVDIAKMLLLCSALMYERADAHKLEIVAELIEVVEVKPEEEEEARVNDIMSAGASYKSTFGWEARSEQIHDKIEEELDVGAMQRYAAKMGLEFHVVSEMNSQGMSYNGLFYSPDDNFIILAFKGTSASEFDEWLTNCSFSVVEGGSWLKGFGRVQKGFMDRMFPGSLKPGARLPYDSIRLATEIVSNIMAKYREPGTEINVYITGHSLGGAMASLAYARASARPSELGPHTRLRDGFAFGCPPTCDNISLNAFNNNILGQYSHPRTLWRITAGRDLVATGFPSWGNVPYRILSAFNLFGFAHLGTEITLKAPPTKSILSGHSLIPGSKVEVITSSPVSVTTKSTGSSTAEPAQKPNLLYKLMYITSWIPLLRSVVDHCPWVYWDQLSALQKGQARWNQRTW